MIIVLSLIVSHFFPCPLAACFIRNYMFTTSLITFRKSISKLSLRQSAKRSISLQQLADSLSWFFRFCSFETTISAVDSLASVESTWNSDNRFWMTTLFVYLTSYRGSPVALKREGSFLIVWCGKCGTHLIYLCKCIEIWYEIWLVHQIIKRMKNLRE